MKYHSKRTWNSLWNCEFDSKAESQRAGELWLLQMAGEITDLQRQVKFVLSEEPKVSIKIDFFYIDKEGNGIYEDVKGFETREFRVKRAWLKEQKGIQVRLVK